MRVPITVHRQYSNLSRRTPKVAFPLTLRTSPQRQTLSPSLLQFRASSSSDDENCHLYKQLRRLAHSQKAFEDLEAKVGRTNLQRIQSLRKMTANELNTLMKQVRAADKEYWMNLSDVWKRVTLESGAESRNSSGSRKGLGIRQLIEEKYAEPLARLTPDELKLIDNAFRRGSKAVWIKSILRRVPSVAASFGFAYLLFRYLSAN